MKKITMVGVSGSGKTCFVYAMHNYMSIAQNGFIFTAKNPDVDLDLSDGWDQIAYDGVWPDGTTTSQEYDFYVQYANTKIMEFSWCDYRGGALLDRSTETDTANLLKRINDSSCLVITIGADTMKEIIDGNVRKAKEFTRLSNIINRFSAENGRRIPIVISLTKADMYTTDEQKKLLSIIKTYFNILFVPDADWLVSIIPIQLGSSLGKNEDGSVSGRIEPRNVQIPVLFFVSAVLREMTTTMSAKLKDISINKSDYKTKISIENNKGWFSKFWNGDKAPAYVDKVDKLNTDEQAILKKLPEIEKMLESMSEQFRVCKMFYKGKEI
jgi:GTPase SAR1 family protein